MTDAPAAGELGADTAAIEPSPAPEIAPDIEDADRTIVHTRIGDADWLLCDLIHYANHGLTPGITLHVAGTIVTGVLIGGDQYIQEFAATISDAVRRSDLKDEADAVQEAFSVYRAAYTPEELEKRAEPTFIHLKDARFMTPGSGFNMDTGVLWRGRVSHVSGFTLGTLKQDKA